MTPKAKDLLIQSMLRLEESIKKPVPPSYEPENWFYNVIAPLVSNDGFDPMINPNTILQGIEVLCAKRNSAERIGVQFSSASKQVPLGQVQWFFSTAVSLGYNRVIMIGPAGFDGECYRYRNYVDPANMELMDLGDLKNWVSRIEVESDPALLDHENIIKLVSKVFIEKIATDPAYLLNLEWRELEKIIAEIFAGLAFTVTLTPPSKDGGKDLILEMINEGNAKTYIVEIKHWRSMQKVGQNSIKDFLNVICNEKSEKGIFLSTYGFTENAFEGLTELERTKIRFGTEDKIVSLCKTYLKVKSGIWTPLQDLQEVLLEQTV